MKVKKTYKKPNTFLKDFLFNTVHKSAHSWPYLLEFLKVDDIHMLHYASRK